MSYGYKDAPTIDWRLPTWAKRSNTDQNSFDPPKSRYCDWDFSDFISLWYLEEVYYCWCALYCGWDLGVVWNPYTFLALTHLRLLCLYRILRGNSYDAHSSEKDAIPFSLVCFRKGLRQYFSCFCLGGSLIKLRCISNLGWFTKRHSYHTDGFWSCLIESWKWSDLSIGFVSS